MKNLALACALTFSAALAGAALETPVSAQGWAGGDFRGLPDGSWRTSCRSPQMRGSVLWADCRTTANRWVRTSINVNSCRSGIGNNNGRLICEDRGGAWNPGGNLPGGSWRQSCRNGLVRGSFFSAQCPDTRNRLQNTSIDTRSCRSNRFGNDNGRLICEGAGAGAGLPGGSWRQSCRNEDIRGDRVIAQCRNTGGNWNNTSIGLRQCRSNRLGNNNGQLVCE